MAKRHSEAFTTHTLYITGNKVVMKNLTNPEEIREFEYSTDRDAIQAFLMFQEMIQTYRIY